jgi:DNA-binding NtrC family response regulator
MTVRSPTIMIVDDEAPVRTAIGAVLDLEGYPVVEATNGEQAIQLLRHRPVDAVICDVRMPGGDGIGLAGWIANNAPAITLLLISGWRRSTALRRLPEEVLFFQKPFPMNDMLGALKKRLADRHR